MLFYLKLTVYKHESMDSISIVFGFNTCLPAKMLSTFDQYLFLV